MRCTLTQNRILRPHPERVWRALTDPVALPKLNPPDGFLAEVLEFDFREGGGYSIAFRDFITGQAHVLRAR